jgi:hypothetical protein
LKRNTQLAQYADVERQIQGLRNLETHHHAATRQRDDDAVLATSILGE